MVLRKKLGRTAYMVSEAQCSCIPLLTQDGEGAQRGCVMGSGSHSPAFFCPVLELGSLLVSHKPSSLVTPTTSTCLASDSFLMCGTDHSKAQRCQQLPGVYSTEAGKAESSLKLGTWGVPATGPHLTLGWTRFR